jgi:hypothetical protein
MSDAWGGSWGTSWGTSWQTGGGGPATQGGSLLLLGVGSYPLFLILVALLLAYAEHYGA